MRETLGIWAGVICTFAIYSYLWRENLVYRIAEHTYVGCATAYSLAWMWHNYTRPIIVNDLGKEHKWSYIISIILAAMMYTRFTRKYIWMSRIPIALNVGYGMGYGLALGPRTYLRNLDASFVNIFDEGANTAILGGPLNQILFFVGIVCTLAYFFFTRKQEGVLAWGATIGRWTMMIAFGAAFGNTVMARIALFIGRFQFLMGDWLGLL